MVLVLLSSVNPFSSSSAASPLSPRSGPSSSTSSFFAILSPMFDYTGSEDESQVSSTPTTPASGAQFIDASHDVNGPASPSLMPPPLRFRRRTSPKPLSSNISSPKDKKLPPLPVSPSLSSPFSPSPLRLSYAPQRQPSEPTPRSTPSPLPDRSHFGSVPEVHISTPVHTSGTFIRRRPAPLDTSRLSPAFGPRHSAGLLLPETPAPLYSATSDHFPSPTSSYGPTTPKTAEYVPLALSLSLPSPAPFSPREIWSAGTEAEDDGCSMLVPLAIELPRAEHKFVLPQLEPPKKTGLRKPGVRRHSSLAC